MISILVVYFLFLYIIVGSTELFLKGDKGTIIKTNARTLLTSISPKLEKPLNKIKQKCNAGVPTSCNTLSEAVKKFSRQFRKGTHAILLKQHKQIEKGNKVEIVDHKCYKNNNDEVQTNHDITTLNDINKNDIQCKIKCKYKTNTYFIDYKILTRDCSPCKSSPPNANPTKSNVFKYYGDHSPLWDTNSNEPWDVLILWRLYDNEPSQIESVVSSCFFFKEDRWARLKDQYTDNGFANPNNPKPENKMIIPIHQDETYEDDKHIYPLLGKKKQCNGDNCRKDFTSCWIFGKHVDNPFQIGFIPCQGDCNSDDDKSGIDIIKKMRSLIDDAVAGLQQFETDTLQKVEIPHGISAWDKDLTCYVYGVDATNLNKNYYPVSKLDCKSSTIDFICQDNRDPSKQDSKMIITDFNCYVPFTHGDHKQTHWRMFIKRKKDDDWGFHHIDRYHNLHETHLQSYVGHLYTFSLNKGAK